jgi:hypothetical protein
MVISPPVLNSLSQDYNSSSFTAAMDVGQRTPARSATDVVDEFPAMLATGVADVIMRNNASRHFLTNVPRPRGGSVSVAILALKKKTA